MTYRYTDSALFDWVAAHTMVKNLQWNFWRLPLFPFLPGCACLPGDLLGLVPGWHGSGALSSMGAGAWRDELIALWRRLSSLQGRIAADRRPPEHLVFLRLQRKMQRLGHCLEQIWFCSHYFNLFGDKLECLAYNVSPGMEKMHSYSAYYISCRYS